MLTSHHEGKEGQIQNQVKAKVFARFKSPDAVNRAPYLYLAHRRAKGGEPPTLPDTVCLRYLKTIKCFGGSEANLKPENVLLFQVSVTESYSIMIQLQVHLQLPCYDFYFL